MQSSVGPCPAFETGMTSDFPTFSGSVERPATKRRVFMGNIWSVASVAVVASVAQAQDSVLVHCVVGPGPSHIERLDWGGNVVASSPAFASPHNGLDVASNGNWVTTISAPPGATGVEILDPSGVFQYSFPTLELTAFAGDVSLFADDTIAVCDNSYGVYLYTPGGVFLGVFVTGFNPYWSTVDAQDRLWVTERTNTPSTIRTFDRAGTQLQSFAVPFKAGDLVVAPNGELWVMDTGWARVQHLSSTGVALGSFSTGFTTGTYGIALAMDGSIWTSCNWIPEIRRFSPGGTLLQTIPLASTGARALCSIVDCGVLGAYCTAGTSANGCVATLSSNGSPSAAGSTPFSVVAQGLEGQRTALVFYGTSGELALPWGANSSSYLCVKPPTQRTPASTTGGTPAQCDGSLALNWNAFFVSNPGALRAPLQPGANFWAQAWCRDPASPKSTSLSDALAFRMCP
jgi:hypothetical protein